VDVQPSQVGRQVVLILEQGDVTRPIIFGVLRGEEGASQLAESRHVSVDADGERLVVNARHQIVFQCGKASITLTAAGKVLIQGTYVLSRSSGVNRIRGGSVQVKRPSDPPHESHGSGTCGRCTTKRRSRRTARGSVTRTEHTIG